MMNCWKTINFTKQYGSQRLFILSSLTMLATFIFTYVPATYVFMPGSFYDNYFIFFAAGLWLMYPVHKLLHYLPIAHLGIIVKKQLIIKYGFMPIIYIRITEPISKRLFLTATLAPMFIINSLLLAACFVFPHYVHYLVILFAFHAGLSFSDIVCAKNVLNAPNQSYVEENEDGFEILLRSNH
ncbi:DUF3267 domain-containing protein [Cytobacillus firmus]|uniref:DUF3267 domain-containing protein n=1 Tax=Cytobacillus firmus TaxID=1399 RepID=UPI0018CD2C0F|nr:DUF3267 domain-containing protein [Cytobacillus firmus]MBG9443211.1 hypothetical protein [Cytobacillus firmus]MBG9449826.1 hypothetical protein [Cytobacillus firmus]MBG9589692.1 hypothetical protein [Cytobacillus firmus]URT72117.1 DUF3267 domain-containing protein [Cytobacillus firmus]USK40130.1 DUF3267 domain-containing protein [Cytobacillus firmus]